ncbi:hypothetical protein LVB87_02785 [Lysobacter sp. KIS68-7]|uniref:hypothetical protein n=1 Tax=Lysobacter sp. KIS68-7 TaxID=2904252 RepID=UPI001E4DC767|nr:hypothetical protein [Lysobacter sp. KIS68-7]UHQ20102.1 hypothetical protein LVB87_02785 [Lysobacter sp. KIS68-7]
MRALLLTTSLAIACTACTGREAPSATTPASSTAAAPTAATVIAPPAVTTAAPAATTVAPPATGPMPAEGAITFNGFGPAPWGASEEQVRQAWGRDLEGAQTEPNGCYYLFPQPRTESGYRIAFMMETSKLGRIDVRVPEIAAPGGGRVGMDKAELHRLYPAITEQKHKYVEGALNLRAMDPQGGPGVILFELDAQGKATAWRVGVPPQVDYVEGCS